MPNAQDELVDLLRGNHFCIGVKRGKRYVCGGKTNEDAKSKTIELLNEAIERIQRWSVWDSWWVEEVMDEWLEKRDRLEIQLRGKYGDDVVNDLLRLVDKFISYTEDFWRYWHEVGNDVEKLVNDLINGKAEVIIWEGEKGTSVHGEFITLEVERTSTGGITVQLKPNGLEGVNIEVPDVFRKTMSGEEKFVNELLAALRGGFEETDGRIEKGNKAAMDTTQIWQAIVWSILYPGKMRVYIDAVNLNENSMTIRWRLRSSHDSLKGKILNNVDKLGEVGILAFTFTAVLGDGWADVAKVVINGRAYDEAVIEIAMSDEKFEMWRPLLDKLKEMGFRSSKPSLVNGDEVEVRFYGSNAIDLARAMINALPSILRDILDALAFEKWNNLRRIAEMELKWRRGEMRITVAGYEFTVHVQKGTVELVHRARDDVEVEEVINALRAVYSIELQFNVYRSGKYRVVAFLASVFEKYSDIKEQVIRVLCRKYERTKDERKRQEIIKTLRRLTPTEGAIAAEYLNRGLCPNQTQAT